MRTFPPWAKASAAARRTAVRTQGQRPQVRPLCSAGRGRRGRRSWLPASRLAHLTAPAATQAPSPALLPIAGPHAAVTATVPSSHLSEPRVVGCPGGSEVSAWPGQGPQRRGRPHQEEQGCGVGARRARTAAPALSASALSSGQSCALGGRGLAGPASRLTAAPGTRCRQGTAVLPAPFCASARPADGRDGPAACGFDHSDV